MILGRGRSAACAVQLTVKSIKQNDSMTKVRVDDSAAKE